MDAVVFDFDGVICNSMPGHAAAYADVLEPLGISVTQRSVFLLEGARSESIIRDLAEAAGVSLEPQRIAELADAKQHAFKGRGDPALYPGALEVVEAMQARTATAVVTGTRLENLRRLLPGTIDGFGAIMSQEHYTNDKPHPEPYANAAAALGVDPARCIAVENALRGIHSARAAGYGHVIAIATTLSPGDLAEAGPDAIVGDHASLGDTITAALEAP